MIEVQKKFRYTRKHRREVYLRMNKYNDLFIYVCVIKCINDILIGPLPEGQCRQINTKYCKCK